MSSRFYFGASDESTSDLSDPENDSSLPFPKPIDRAAFLAQDFDATKFLSSLSNRFQTLEDLQTELRELSQSLSKELVDLVNDNYQDFLSLGSTLAGGEERIEEIRVGLLGFQRDIKGVRDQIDARRQEVSALLAQKKSLKQEIRTAKTLLEISERMDELEIKLGLIQRAPTNQKLDKVLGGTSNDVWGEEWQENVLNDSDDEYEDGEATFLTPKLQRRINDFSIVLLLTSKYSPHQPFILAEQSRIRRIREVLLLDMDASIKAEPDVKLKQRIMQLREMIDE